MSELPKKLIVVGMRFQKGAKELLHKVTSLPNSDITLQREPNDKASKGIAVAAYLGNARIGYVREADLDSVRNALAVPDNVDTIRRGYSLTKIYDNYLVLELTTFVKNFSQEYAGTFIKNPCAEISLPGYKDECSIKNPEDNQIKKEIKMNVGQNLRNSFFREITNLVIDLQTNKLAVKTADGIISYDKGTATVNPITDFGIAVPAFAIRTEVSALVAGDLIVTDNETVFFNKKTETGFEVVTTTGEVKQLTNVANMFFGKNTVMAVKNMFGDTSGMNPLMLAMLMGDGKTTGGKIDAKTFMLMSMMGNAKDMNPLMFALLLDK